MKRGRLTFQWQRGVHQPLLDLRPPIAGLSPGWPDRCRLGNRLLGWGANSGLSLHREIGLRAGRRPCSAPTIYFRRGDVRKRSAHPRTSHQNSSSAACAPPLEM